MRGGKDFRTTKNLLLSDTNEIFNTQLDEIYIKNNNIINATTETTATIQLKKETVTLINQLLYDKTQAIKEIAVLRRECKSKLTVETKQQKPRLPEKGNFFEKLKEELGTDSASRLRFLSYTQYSMKELRALPIVYRICFDLYFNILDDEDRKELHSWLQYLYIDRLIEEEDVYLALRTLSAIVKKSQADTFGTRWKILVDLHLMRDFQKNLGIEHFIEDVRRWATGETIHMLDGSEEKFLSYFRLGVRRFLDAAPVKEFKPPADGGFVFQTVQSFSENPNLWARSGASTGTRLWIKSRKSGKIVKARKSKWATALAMDAAEVMQMLMTPALQKNYANEKREAGKVRAMVMGDIPTYLKMTFVGDTFEYLLKGHPNSTLFMTSQQMTDLWKTMSIQAASNNYIFIPIDQSEFDHNVSMTMINIMIDEMDSFMRQRNPPNLEDLLMVNNQVRFALNGGTVIVGDKEFEIQKGVMSGWRFTALYDTLANAGEFYAIQRWLSDKGVSNGTVSEPVFQGDDIRVAVRSYSDAILLWLGYSEANFDVNPGKFFIRSDSDEFLRMVAYDGKTTGYPARAIRSLVFRSPLTIEKIKGEERLSEQLQNWTTVAQRLGYFRFINLMVQDMSRANGVTVDKILKLLATPTVLGGLGLSLTDGTLGAGSFTSGYRVVKARFDADWLPIGEQGFIGTKALSKRWAISNEILSRSFFNTIEYKGRGKQTSPFELREVSFVVPIWKANPYVSKMQTHYLAFYRTDVPQVVLDIYSKEDPFVLVDYLTPDSQITFSLLKDKASKRVQIAWLRRELPFSLPVSTVYSGLAVSNYGSDVINYWWYWMMQKVRVNWSLVERTALSAYYDTAAGLREHLPFSRVVIGG